MKKFAFSFNLLLTHILTLHVLCASPDARQRLLNVRLTVSSSGFKKAVLQVSSLKSGNIANTTVR